MLTLAEAIEADDELIIVAGVERGEGLKGLRFRVDSEIVRFVQRRNDVPQPGGQERWWVARARHSGGHGYPTVHEYGPDGQPRPIPPGWTDSTFLLRKTSRDHGAFGDGHVSGAVAHDAGTELRRVRWLG